MDNFNLLTNTTPFGLLSEEERLWFREEDKLEMYRPDGWQEVRNPSYSKERVYRLKLEIGRYYLVDGAVGMLKSLGQRRIHLENGCGFNICDISILRPATKKEIADNIPEVTRKDGQAIRELEEDLEKAHVEIDVLRRQLENVQAINEKLNMVRNVVYEASNMPLDQMNGVTWSK